MGSVAKNLPSSLQNIDPGLRLGDIKGLADGVSRLKYADTQDSVTASTTQTQAGGTVLNAVITRITSANASDAVTLGFSAQAGHQFIIINDSGQTITLFPKAGDKINDANINASVTIADNTYSVYSSPLKGLWFGGAISFEA